MQPTVYSTFCFFYDPETSLFYTLSLHDALPISIRSADRVARPLAGISVTASKGLFGRFGRFWNSTLGSYRLFLTNRDTVVWLQTTTGLIGISPDRPDEFVALLRTRI